MGENGQENLEQMKNKTFNEVYLFISVLIILY